MSSCNIGKLNYDKLQLENAVVGYVGANYHLFVLFEHQPLCVFVMDENDESHLSVCRPDFPFDEKEHTAGRSSSAPNENIP